jgi:ribonuclease PH
VHGSALFERGETQILGVTTLNMLRMEQMVDTLNPESRKRYMHHYNFPPYSTGETGRVGSPKRREIGHGALAERALVPVLPSKEAFPYAIRQVSEALGSNGSTSMGSVCASTMSLLNAGVPLKAPVAGIAMGLVYEGGKYATLTDILGAEDAFGDMDFKVAGTPQFVTALQLDTKLDGIPSGVLAAALQQARTARLAILEVMNEAIDEPDEMAPTAPRVLTVKIPVDKIGEVIGPKGKMINQIQADTGADITVEDDGTIYIGATDGPSAEAALATINMIANPTMPKVGERFLGTVVKTAAFGAFVSLMPGKDGLVHISKLGNGKRIGKVEDVVNVGDKLQVEIQEIDQRGKISLVPVSNDAPEACRGPGGAVSRRGTAHASPPGHGDGRRTGDGAPHGPPGRAPCRLGVDAGGPLGRLRHLGRRRQPGRAAVAARRVALPRAPAVQGHGAAGGAGHLLGDGRGRRRDERLHRQGVHLLLRAAAGGGPAAGRRRAERHGAVVAGAGRGRRGRAGRDPRGDRHARRRPRRRGPRRLRRALFGDSPLGRPVIGTVESIEGLSRSAIAGFYRRRYALPQMVVAAAAAWSTSGCSSWCRPPSPTG